MLFKMKNLYFEDEEVQDILKYIKNQYNSEEIKIDQKEYLNQDDLKIN